MTGVQDEFWAYRACPRLVVGIEAHRRLGLVHRLRVGDGRHACEDVAHPLESTTHRRSVALEDTTADQAPATGPGCDCAEVLETAAARWRAHGAALVANLPGPASRSQAENGNRKAIGLAYAARVLRAHLADAEQEASR